MYILVVITFTKNNKTHKSCNKIELNKNNENERSTYYYKQKWKGGPEWHLPKTDESVARPTCECH